jgi:hypothetical protein
VVDRATTKSARIDVSHGKRSDEGEATSQATSWVCTCPDFFAEAAMPSLSTRTRLRAVGIPRSPS